ncbi:MAG: cytochrome b5 domain-containing protein [Anaerocolumna sp.]
MRNFTLEELSYFDGKEGRLAYVAVNGNVYDLSEKVRWAGGTHFCLFAGNDLTAQFVGCHLGLTSMLEQLSLVGILVIGETQ